MQKILAFILLAGWVQPAIAQPYALVIRGGHVIDPRNHIDAVLDLAVNDGRIVRVGKDIDVRQAAQVVDACGLYVTPGLIDMHTHVFFGTDAGRAYSNGPMAVQPDGFTFRTGVTTVVDAGCAGWRSFPLFKSQVIDRVQTRVLAFLNIVGEGMRGGAYEQDTSDMDGKLTGLTAQRYREDIVGVKVAHFEHPNWKPVDEAVKAGRLAGIPVMIDFGGSEPPLSLEELFMRRLRPGDIFTHCYGQLRDRESIVDTLTKQVKPFVWAARKKGIVFDVGYGEISFAFSQAQAAVAGGFYPHSISTDMHARSVNDAMKDILNVMSKFMAMGVPLDSVIAETTWNPAREIRHEELGHLSVGAVADIAIFGMREGTFGFYDYTGAKITGSRKLECEMTVRGGRIVYDLDGIAQPLVLPRPLRRRTHSAEEEEAGSAAQRGGDARMALRVGATPEYIKALTSEWQGERFPDGRPKVPDEILERLKKVSLEDAWNVLRNKGYQNQFEGDWHVIHPDSVMTGRVVTAQYMPLRPDLAKEVKEQGRVEGRNQQGGTNSWPIDILVDGDVYVADSYLKMADGTLIGDNLGNAIYARSHRGVVFYGSVRDEAGLSEIEGFNGWVKGVDPSYIQQMMLTGIN